MILQRDTTDCGPACLAFVARHYGLKLSVARLRSVCGTDSMGSTALGVVEAAQELGFSAKGVRGAEDCLDRIPKPAIAHCRMRGVHEHFVVLTRVKKNRVDVMDPAVGKVGDWSREEFLKQWSGVLVLLAPGATLNAADFRSSIGIYDRYWRLLWPHRLVLLQAFFGAVIATVLSLSSSFYVGQIVDRVIPDGSTSLLQLLSVAMILVLVVRLGITCAQSILMMRVGQVLDSGLMVGYFRHLGLTK